MKKPDSVQSSSKLARTSLAALEKAVEKLGGTPRAGQELMAQTVAEIADEGGHLLVQAGTGTGKSLGYLIPAMVYAVQNEQVAVVSTATLALQRQIVTKDAPLAAEVVEQVTGKQPTVALLKGWQNYLCVHKVNGGYPSDDDLFAAAGLNMRRKHKGEESLGDQVLRLNEWASLTQSGDRDDLVPGVSDRAWAQVSLDRTACLGKTCPVYEQCFAYAAREQAAQADIVVTNHTMLGVAAAGNTGLIPPHQLLVVDEAHELASRVRSQGAITLSATSINQAAKAARRCQVIATELETAAKTLQEALENLPQGRLAALTPSLQDALILLDAAVRQALEDLKDGKKPGEAPSPELVLAKSELTKINEALSRLLSNSIASAKDVLWCEQTTSSKDPVRLRLAPIEVASTMANTLIEDHSVIMTSATLTLGGSFNAMANEVGLSFAGGWDQLDVGSPFNYSKQGILYVAAHLPKPTQGISPAALEEMCQLAQAANGGMLGLFSSRQATQEAAKYLREHTDLPVLVQGEDQLPTLVEEFKADENACLLGTLSLWQGVDVPGQTCRLVVIDRIPFPRPDDPLAQARIQAVQDGGGNGFMQVSANHAALLLAQAAGRLIRSSSDRGVVAVLDSRLRTARYGGYLIKSMPDFWRTTDSQLVHAALERLAV